VFDVLLLIQHSLHQGLAARSKKDWFVAVAKGYGQGFFTKPTRQMPGELLATLTTEARERINC
jgi:hypothetical protein